jgi:hypothetical protein
MMKTIAYLIASLVFCLIVAISNGEELPKSESITHYTGKWAEEDFAAVASRYYKSLENSQLDKTVTTLNDLSEIITDPKAHPNSPSEYAKLTFSRWGKKPCFMTHLYQVVEQGDSRFKKDFKEIFGKNLKHYEVICASYQLDGSKEKTSIGDPDYSRMLSAELFSRIDLWLMDETGKCYVVLSYKPASSFKGNMRNEALKRLGIHGAKLWDD